MIFHALWVGWLALFAVVETVALVRDRRTTVKGDTLSVHLRSWFRTDTHLGRSAFIVAWCAFGAWMLLHILGLA